MTASHMVLSTESLSSGYGSDSFLPVNTETMDTEDYELWERRQVGLIHRLNMELDLQSLLGSMSRDVHSCTHWLRRLCKCITTKKRFTEKKYILPQL